MGFFSSVSPRLRALVRSATSMEESVGPMHLIERWLGKPFDKVSTSQHRSKTPLSWLECVSLVGFSNGRFTS